MQSIRTGVITILFSLLCVVGVNAQDAAVESAPTNEQENEQELSLRTTYINVPLKTDLSHLNDNQREMIRILISAADDIDKVFWQQAYGDRDSLLDGIDNDADRRFAGINYGPWDRLNDNEPFIEGFPAKPLGANFYPRDMTADEFELHLKTNPDESESFKSLYTVVRRDDGGKLVSIPYSEHYKTEFTIVAEKLRAAAQLADDPIFEAYLLARADALLSNDYLDSDMVWMDMKNNMIDVVIGPIENYEDKMFEHKAACECYVLVKDLSWSERLSKYAAMLPDLQKKLPVDDAYKQDPVGTDSDLNAYDVIYYAGDCNSGSKTIAINLPNDERVQEAKGSRRLQLKNAMQTKYDNIMIPIADLMIVEDQRKHITFNAFFSNTMFHEVAHGLGIKQTINGSGTVRAAMGNAASALEEGKADILGLYMVTELLEQGELAEGQLEDYYVTFMAGIFRSVRFGASSAHGKANMIRFNFFEERNAFTREESGRYRVNMSEMKAAMEELGGKLLMLQGNGDYGVARTFTDEYAQVGAELSADLDRISRAGIPTDVVFDQGIEVLGLDK